MGRKLRGAALRAHKRGKANAEEMVDQTADRVETQQVTTKTNEELFVIDTTGSKNNKANMPRKVKQEIQKEKVQKQKMPKLEQERVNELVEKHDSAKLQQMVKEGKAKLRGDRHAIKQKQHKKNFDLWANEDDNTKKRIKSSNAQADKVLQYAGIKTGIHVAKVVERVSKKDMTAVAVDVAHAGQSYRPDPKAYQAVVQDAVSLELRRQEAEEELKAPLTKGMSPETRALLLGDSDSSDDDDEEDENDNTQDDNTNRLMPKRQNKLTRAERNKQKRLRQEKASQEAERKRKKLLNSVAEIPRFKKELKKHVREHQDKKEKIKADKEAAKPTLGKDVLQRNSQKDPIRVPTLPVALEEEHKEASLRTIKPKGSMLTDRMVSLADRNLTAKRKRPEDRKRGRGGKKRKIKYKEAAMAMDFSRMG
ncbi:Nop53 (60S ribosomal biogenesis) [Seminavis robusta]|uniref:Ribosome biogenesis protein NOP53 n=1 Tax=Seminavis robusta TaxID=568900 RepID=A0A9N8DPH1_9STRA|nr:Nop53 (60S ribosomal biogenesis) [Seminavis robusta]|eukprot:Sro246_g097680.1 Nop53 (60S ribosomal biogenesis) (422) ;mRNA; f:37075-38340